MAVPAVRRFIGLGAFMGFFRHGVKGEGFAWRDAGLDPNSESRDLWQQANTHKSPTSTKIRSTRTGREKMEGNERNEDIYLDSGMDRMEGGWIYFKVNVWQFRWNTVSLSNRRWKRTGEDERIKQQAAGRKRELLRYLSPGTCEKTWKKKKKS